MNDQNEEKQKKGMGGDIFGEDIVPSEEMPEENPIINEGIVGAVRPDQDQSSEAISGSHKTIDRQKKINNATPELTSDDLDAAWDDEQSTGEEHSLGSTPTPDQDQTDAISKPWGTTYQSHEELDVLEKGRKLENDRYEDEEEGLNKK